MPPRLRLRSLAQLADLSLQRNTTSSVCLRCTYATAAVTPTPAPTEASINATIPYISRYPSHLPPSYRSPKYRKSQLLRSYVSLLQTTPLVIFFQYNSLKSAEWASIRRELASALGKIDDQLLKAGANPSDVLGQHIRLQIVKTNMFEPALRITEYFKPGDLPLEPVEGASFASEREDPSLTHALSHAAYLSAQQHKNIHPLTPMLVGNIAALTFPSVSPQYIKAALSILAPQAGTFPAPTKRAAPTYHVPAVQDGLKKLTLLGARIDGQVFDQSGTRWVGSIDGGIDGLRAQIVAMLQGVGGGITQTLESASRSLWFTMEARRRMLDEEANPKEEGKTE